MHSGYFRIRMAKIPTQSSIHSAVVHMHVLWVAISSSVCSLSFLYPIYLDHSRRNLRVYVQLAGHIRSLTILTQRSLCRSSWGQLWSMSQVPFLTLVLGRNFPLISAAVFIQTFFTHACLVFLVNFLLGPRKLLASSDLRYPPCCHHPNSHFVSRYFPLLPSLACNGSYHCPGVTQPVCFTFLFTDYQNTCHLSFRYCFGLSLTKDICSGTSPSILHLIILFHAAITHITTTIEITIRSSVHHLFWTDLAHVKN